MYPPAAKWLTLLLLAALFPAPARAESNTEKELAELARSIKKWLDGQDESAVALQPFSSGDAIPANGGPGLCLTLRLELERTGVKVQGSARFTVTGRYRAAMHRKSRRNMLYVQVKLVDRDGKPHLDLNRGIFGEQALLETVAPTVALVPGAPPAAREEAVANRIEKPEAHLSGTHVSATRESPYSVEVLVKKGTDYEPLGPRLVKGLAYVSLKRDDVYAVRLTNRSKYEAAATLLIDGLHVFCFSENRGKDGKPVLLPFLVPAGKSVLVRGWPITLKRSDEFLVTGYSRSAVAELRADRSKLGVITAQFAAAWPKGEAPPDDEKGAKAMFATGRGSPIETPFRTVQRDFGACRAQVSIRYAR